MSHTIPASVLVSEDWQIADEAAPKPASLIVEGRRGALVLPWFRFVYAEGNNTVLQAVFATHSVKVTGVGLAGLLIGFADMRVIRIVEPTEHQAKFSVRELNGGTYHGAAIHSITAELLK